jgi:hypothetical protein
MIVNMRPMMMTGCTVRGETAEVRVMSSSDSAESGGLQDTALRWRSVLQRSEAQYFRDQADRLLTLAKKCSDPDLRSELTTIAAEWVQKAKTLSNRSETS